MKCRLCRDVGRGAEHEGWAVVVRDDGNVGEHGDITGDRSADGILDGGLSLSWDDPRNSD